MISNDSDDDPTLRTVTEALTVTLSTTSGGNITSDEVLADKTINILIVVFCILVLILGIVGNVLVLVVFGSRYKKLKACEMFMVSLAVADLLGTIVVPTKTFMELLEHSFHHIGDAGCKVISFFSMSSIAVSAITLVIISIDRFLIVKWPLRKRPENIRIFYIILVSWILGFSVGLAYFVGDRIRLHYDDDIQKHHKNLTQDGLGFCRDFASHNDMLKHVLAAMSIEIFIPIVVMTILYSLIIYELRRGARNTIFKHQEREKRMRLKQNRKATCLLVAIVVVFYVCVTPINVFYLFYMYDAVNLTNHQINHLFSALSMLQMINSCANPIIYSKLHTSFRRTTLRLLCSCCFTKFKGYRWGSFGGSFRYAVTTSLSLRSKRSSRGSLASTKDFLINRFDSRKGSEDVNHNRNIFHFKNSSLSNNSMFGSRSPINHSVHLSDLKSPSPSAGSPVLRTQISDGDDDVFQMTSLDQIGSLSALTPKSKPKSHTSRFREIFKGKLMMSEKKNNKDKEGSSMRQDERFLSPSMSYESPLAADEKRRRFAQLRGGVSDIHEETSSINNSQKSLNVVTVDESQLCKQIDNTDST